MAYTPINWQVGDTITAEKLNRCDNGWGFESEQLFEETITTAAGSFGISAELEYSETIESTTLTITFDGTDYVCERIDAMGMYFYGGFTQSGPDFTDYPFALQSNYGTNTIYTSTAGTYSVAASGNAIAVSDSFSSAVNSCIVSQEIPYLRIDVMDSSTVLSWGEINSAFTSGYICVVSGFGPVLQMWSMGIPEQNYMATGGTGSYNQQFDPAIWRTPGSSSDVGVSFYKYNSQMP